MKKIDRTTIITGITGFFFMAIILSGCGTSNSSVNRGYENVCKSFESGVQLISISPVKGPQFGDRQVDAVIKNFNAGFTPTVYLGNKARGIMVTSQSNNNEVSISFTTAGTPTTGTYPLVIANDSGSCAYFANAYTYEPPVSDQFKTFVAVGASYTAGFQSDSYNEVSQLNGPAAWVARQAGAYFPIPLIKMPGMPPIKGFEALNTTGDFTLNTGDIAQAVMNALINPQTGLFDIPEIFEDPSVTAYNIAIPGATIEDEVLGPDSTTGRVLGIIMLSNILFAPYNNAPLDTKDIKSEIEMAKDLHPTIIMSTDLYGNDLITANTTLKDFTLYITQAVKAFAATGAQVFLGNVPHISIFPSNQKDALNALANCGETFANVSLQTLDQAAGPPDACAAIFATDTCAKKACETFTSTNARIEAFNTEFSKVVAQYPNVHIVKFDELMQGKVKIAGQGVTYDTEGFPVYTVDGIPLKMSHLGGFYSLDDLHLTNTGYAVLASIFVQSINDTLNLNIALPPLPGILAGDPLSPPALSNYCSRPSNQQKKYCQCITGNHISVTTFTCSNMLY